MKTMTFQQQVDLTDSFWSTLRETVRQHGIPYQWKALNDQLPDTEKSYCMQNFRIAAGKEKGQHNGCVFQDSDVAKWIEGASYSLTWHPDAELEKVLDSAIDDIVAAQRPDGYLNTYYIINGLDKRWTNLMDHHELYCAGHLIEAAVANYQATGKRKLLDAMIRYVAHIRTVLGAEEGKLHGYPGHPIIEMALMRLYEVTRNPEHMELAVYFIKQRGQTPNFFEEEMKRNGNRCHWENGPLKMAYYQADKPLIEQEVAAGHAVRALYLYSGMVDVAWATDDPTLQNACRRLWNSVVHKRMYITGSIGSSEYGEAFTYDYDLPNDTIYGETCAAIALVFMARRMLGTQARGEYGDVMERALYNGVISGMQLDGQRFFYVNPLEVVPEGCELGGNKMHVKAERQKWFGCSCCPPNLVRMLTSLHQYIYSTDQDTLYTHLYIENAAEVDVAGQKVRLEATTQYPWNGRFSMKLSFAESKEFCVALRIPGWCRQYRLQVNGEDAAERLKDGYAYISRIWRSGDTVTLDMSMPVLLCQANPLVREDAGQVAITRGPLVYCLEEKDNGKNLHLIRLGKLDPAGFTAKHQPELLGGVTVLRCQGFRDAESWEQDQLYAPAKTPASTPVELCYIPYYAWANRGIGEMRVWTRV